MLKKNIKGKAWVIDVNMGYGHQRTAYPLKDLAPNKEVISANDYKDMPKKDKVIWDSSRNFYEFISKFKRFPIVGEFAFSVFDKFQKICLLFLLLDGMFLHAQSTR